MRFAPPWTPLVLGVLIGMTVAVPIAAQSPKQIKKAQKLLDKILLVDGAGSGLDADTVHGMTPGEVAASVTPPTPEETLSALQGVDGTGSGLDADTVRGMTPGADCGHGWWCGWRAASGGQPGKSRRSSG